MTISKALKFALFVFLSLPKTLYFNFRCLSFKKAVRLPFLIGWNTKIAKSHRGVIVFECQKITPFMVRIGFGGSPSVQTKGRGIVNIENGKFNVGGIICLAAGSSLDVSGDLSVGNNFSTNKNAFISCSKSINIGRDVMLGWDVSVFDASGHTVYKEGVPKVSQGAINIGNHVWICSRGQLLKGSSVNDDSIVAWGSVVTKKFEEKNLLIAGNPAIVKDSGVSWGPFVS